VLPTVWTHDPDLGWVPHAVPAGRGGFRGGLGIGGLGNWVPFGSWGVPGGGTFMGGNLGPYVVKKEF